MPNDGQAAQNVSAEELAALRENERSIRSEEIAEMVGVFCTSLAHFTLLLAISLWAASRDGFEFGSISSWLAPQILVFGFVTFPTGYACGWFSHRWFYGTTISVTRMSAVIACIAVITIFGWIAASIVMFY